MTAGRSRPGTVFGALGLYPVAGSDKYELCSPLFEKAEVKLKNKPLVIVAENYAPDRFYARKVFLNDIPARPPVDQAFRNREWRRAPLRHGQRAGQTLESLSWKTWRPTLQEGL